MGLGFVTDRIRARIMVRVVIIPRGYSIGMEPLVIFDKLWVGFRVGLG